MLEISSDALEARVKPLLAVLEKARAGLGDGATTTGVASIAGIKSNLKGEPGI
jgi:hypothetical protein